MFKHQILFVSQVLSLAMSIGCTSRSSDQQIQKNIQAKVSADPQTKDSDVSVAAKDGKVTLSGKVKTPAAQQKLEQIAREEPGTTGVDDQTSIEEEPVASQPPPPVEKLRPQPVVVRAGTALTVRLSQALGSKTSQPGQTFSATLAQPVSAGGRTAMPAGSSATGTVVAAKAKGKIKGEGELVLTLTSITVRGKSYAIRTGSLDSSVKGKGKRTAVTTGGGAAGGALIGGLAGGGKGAGIGALVGAGAGLAGGALTGNKQIEFPAETALTFQLSMSLTLPPPPE